MAKRRPRSPKYPRVPLREAIERVDKVHRAARTYKVPKESVAEALGYSSLNGASVTLIGTLKNYELLHEDKEGVKVTEDAVTILRAPEGDPERAEALRRVAFAPRVFLELREAFGDDLSELPNETTLRYRLEKRGFLEKAADEAIRTYRDNLEFVSEEAPEYTDVDDVEEDQQVLEPPMSHPTANQQTLPSPGDRSGERLSPTPAPSNQGVVAPATVLVFKPTETSEARIELMGEVTQEAIETIRELLEIQKRGFPKEKQPEPPIVQRPTIEMPAPEQTAAE